MEGVSGVRVMTSHFLNIYMHSKIKVMNVCDTIPFADSPKFQCEILHKKGIQNKVNNHNNCNNSTHKRYIIASERL